ncbi:hypothetical protein B0H13DRAFT_1875072 [Mycena leptocephala]|nr:hypothetical protein B0H13DRAFT_1892405 [Mycena leptocephala]KAJ7912270.1 hypothetical protein B0H13DRAFT_1875072 [Mycena leptocephala]
MSLLGGSTNGRVTRDPCQISIPPRGSGPKVLGFNRSATDLRSPLEWRGCRLKGLESFRRVGIQEYVANNSIMFAKRWSRGLFFGRKYSLALIGCLGQLSLPPMMMVGSIFITIEEVSAPKNGHRKVQRFPEPNRTLTTLHLLCGPRSEEEPPILLLEFAEPALEVGELGLAPITGILGGDPVTVGTREFVAGLGYRLSLRLHHFWPTPWVMGFKHSLSAALAPYRNNEVCFRRRFTKLDDFVTDVGEETGPDGQTSEDIGVVEHEV